MWFRGQVQEVLWQVGKVVASKVVTFALLGSALGTHLSSYIQQVVDGVDSSTGRWSSLWHLPGSSVQSKLMALAAIRLYFGTGLAGGRGGYAAESPRPHPKAAPGVLIRAIGGVRGRGTKLKAARRQLSGGDGHSAPDPREPPNELAGCRWVTRKPWWVARGPGYWHTQEEAAPARPR